MILIKMDMPKSCYLCPFTDNEYLVCNAPGKVEESGEVVGTNQYKNYRHENCPLIDFGEYMQDPVTKLLQEYAERINENEI